MLKNQFEIEYSPTLTGNEIVTEILEILDEAGLVQFYTPPASFDIVIPENYTTISVAIVAASDGQVIGVAEGIHDEEVTINKA